MNMNDGYPATWPRCACGAPVLDGHLTCGQLPCNEAAARESRVSAVRARDPQLVLGDTLVKYFGGPVDHEAVVAFFKKACGDPNK